MNKLRKLRKKHNITAEKISKLLDISTRTYYLIEQEKASLSINKIKKLTNLYNCTSDYLLGISEFNILESKEYSDRNKLINNLNIINKE